MHRKLYSYILLASVLLMFFRAEAQPVLLEIRGQVLDLNDKQPLPGAVLQLHEVNRYAVADEEGRFRFENVRPGSYHIHATMLGYRQTDATFTLTEMSAELVFNMKRTAIELKQILVEEDILRSGLKDRPLNIHVVDRSQLEATYTDNFATTLSRVPGLSSINTGTGIGKPVIRGLTANRVMVNHQGIKQEGQQWGTDHGMEIDQYDVARVEVIKGPASLLYGSDAMAGVINVLDAGIPPRESFLSEVLAFYRSNNGLAGASAMVQGHQGRYFYRARYTHQDFGDYHTPTDTFRYNTYLLPIYNQRLKNTAGRERNFSATGGKEGDWGNMQLTVSRYFQEAGMFPGAIGIPRAYNLRHDGDYRNIDIPLQRTAHLRTVMNGRWLLGKSWLHVDAAFQQNHRQEESFPHIHGQGPRPEDNLALDMLLHTYTLNARYYWYPNDSLKMVAGFSGQGMQNRVGGFEFLIPDYLQLTTGSFLFAEWARSDKTTISGGLRADFGHVATTAHWQPVYNSSLEIVDSTLRSPGVQKSFANLSGSIGWSYRPSAKWNLKANLGKSFRMPNAAELGSNGVHHGTFRHEQGDTSLRSEHGYQFDLGAYFDNKVLSVHVTPFFNYFSNYIYLRPTGAFSLLPEAGQVYRYTQADAIFTGTEAMADYHPIEAWHIALTAAYVFNVNTDNGLPLPFTPPFVLRMNTDYHFEPGRKFLHDWHLGLEAEWFAAQMRTDRNEATTPGYLLLHFRTGVKVNIGSRQIQIIAAANNLLDQYYLNHLSRYRIINVSEPGRNLTLTIKVPVARKGD